MRHGNIDLTRYNMLVFILFLCRNIFHVNFPQRYLFVRHTNTKLVHENVLDILYNQKIKVRLYDFYMCQILIY